MGQNEFEKFKETDKIEVREDTNKNNDIKIFSNNDFLLLLIILFLFFANTELFSKQFNFINKQVKQVKNYLDMADATIQALDQASQIPKQMLN